jgi:hypothetical protein
MRIRHHARRRISFKTARLRAAEADARATLATRVRKPAEAQREGQQQQKPVGVAHGRATVAVITLRPPTVSTTPTSP